MTSIDSEAILEAAPVYIQTEVLPAALRAVQAGARAKELQYLGAGGEGILFHDDIAAYKVGRQSDLEDEADALEALSHVHEARPFVPKFIAYYPELRVLVRSLVDGYPGRWGNGSQLRPVYDLLTRQLDKLDFSPPEWKEDSFVISEQGAPPVMVDLGFTSPIRQRAVTWLRESLKRPEYVARQDLFTLQLYIYQATQEGLLSADEGFRMFDSLAKIFGDKKVADVSSEYYRVFGSKR